VKLLRREETPPDLLEPLDLSPMKDTSVLPDWDQLDGGSSEGRGNSRIRILTGLKHTQGSQRHEGKDNHVQGGENRGKDAGGGD